MKIIGIDSSGLTASVAIVEDDVTIAEYTVNYRKTHSQTLLPMLDEIVKMTEQDLSTITAIAIAAGPGSFTGLRIGSATAKGLAEALQKPIVAIPTVDAIAYQMYGTDKLICPLMDARRNQTYSGIYEFVRENDEYRLHTLVEQCVVPLEDMIEQIHKQNREVIFLGDGVPVFREELKEKIKTAYSFAPAYCNRQRAAAVAALGMIEYQKGKFSSAAEHAPEYLRLSQAERERNEAMQ